MNKQEKEIRDLRKIIRFNIEKLINISAPLAVDEWISNGVSLLLALDAASEPGKEKRSKQILEMLSKEIERLSSDEHFQRMQADFIMKKNKKVLERLAKE